MAANEPNDRMKLLTLIDASLRADSKTEHLAETVRVVMEHYSPSDPSSGFDPSQPMPLGDVAAYVDDTLDSHEVERTISSAAGEDPGLMLEIIMAVKSKREADVDVLSETLRSRLMKLSAAWEATPEQPPEAVTEPRKKNGATVPLPTASESPVPLQVEIVPSDRNPKTGRGVLLAVALSVAATVLLVAGWWAYSNRENGSLPIAEDDTVRESIDAVEPDPDPSRPPIDDPPDAPESMLVESPTEDVDNSAPDNFAPEGERGEKPDSVRPNRTPDAAPTDSEPMIVRTPPSRPVAPNGRSPAPRPLQALVAKWSQIDGLLLQTESGGTDDRAFAASSSSSSRPKSLRSVRDGTSTRLAGQQPGVRLRLQTLPLCRATADIEGGGEMVIATDSQIELTHGAAIDLRYGSVAFIGVRSEIWIGPTRAHGITVHSPDGGKFVVTRTVDGMEIDVIDQPVRIGGEAYRNSKVQVDNISMVADRVSDAPERLPRWTRERVDRIEIGRNVLAQISESDNVGASIRQALSGGTVRGNAAMVLRGWLVASHREHLLRLIGHDDALIREAALLQLRGIVPGDPRNREIWRSLRASSRDVRNFGMIRSLFVDYWSGRKPPQTRRDTLLRLLQAPDPATRATADFLLRSFYGKGPQFNLKSNAQTQTRTINAWRAVINRSG